ncbi:MAG: methyl-accepting chemotaxis protein [Gammaproteobacteria bacterium]|jgi:twitching motility protein PilJ|nr:methyl-accepting chemotaxis protein [Gammaproteobacteria bacterium]
MRDRGTRKPSIGGDPPAADAVAAASWSQRLVTVLLVLGMLVAVGLAITKLLERERGGPQLERYLRALGQERRVAGQVADAAAVAARGEAPGFRHLREHRAALQALHRETLTSRLKALPGPPGAQMRALAESADAARTRLSADAERMLDARAAVLGFYERAGALRARIRELGSALRGVADSLVVAGAPAQQVLDAGLQMARLQRMYAALSAVQRGGDGAAAGLEQAAAAAHELEVALDALRRAPPAADAPGAEQRREAVNTAWQLYRSLRVDTERMAASLPQVRPALAAADAAAKDAQALRASLDQLIAGLRGEPGPATVTGLDAGIESALAFAAVALILLGLLVLQQLLRARRRVHALQAQNIASRRAIDALLDEMSGLADGDLTVEAKVTADATGAVAETVNYGVRALRGLVTTIKHTSARLDDSAQHTRGVAKQLAEGSDAQAWQIAQASEAISSMTGAIDSIAGDAAESAAVANRSVDLAGRGAQAVRDTITGMSEIRGRIQETSKRIRRLGDSSQEIGEMVELIDDIADQTNILALNAAMQAAMAGEAGRGFAVVADEVQRLAERSGNATKQIDAIVRTIRRDTNEAVRSMEASMSGVDSGAGVAENAGSALREIENVSSYIAELTRRIADSAGHESREAVRVNETVKSIQAITQESNRGSRATAEAVEALAALALELRRSVAGFKLPPEGGG